jgi:hypothetical protein
MVRMRLSTTGPKYTKQTDISHEHPTVVRGHLVNIKLGRSPCFTEIIFNTEQIYILYKRSVAGVSSPTSSQYFLNLIPLIRVLFEKLTVA